MLFCSVKQKAGTAMFKSSRGRVSGSSASQSEPAGGAASTAKQMIILNASWSATTMPMLYVCADVAPACCFRE